MKTLKNTVAIYDIKQFRRVRLVSSVERWANDQGLRVVKLNRKEILQVPATDFDFIYLPLCWDFDLIKELPSNLPIVIDYDGVAPKRFTEELKNRKVIARRAYNDKRKINADLQVPYIHPPLETTTPDLKDVIIIDIPYWLPIGCQFSYLSLLSDINEHYPRICDALGCSVKFYLTGFFPIEPLTSTHSSYINAIYDHKGDGKNYALSNNIKGLRNISENLIPPIAELTEYDSIIARGLLYISHLADLSDQDITNAISVQTPIWTISRSAFKPSNGITYTLEQALYAMNPKLEAQFEDIKQHAAVNPGDLKQIFKPLSPSVSARDFFQTAFDSSFDIIWNWIKTGETRPDIISKIENAPCPSWWNRFSW